MSSPSSAIQPARQDAELETAKCFGVFVNVIIHWEHCSLVSFKGRELVVDTQDLELSATCSATA